MSDGASYLATMGSTHAGPWWRKSASLRGWNWNCSASNHDPKSTLRYGGVLAISDDFLGDFPRVLATWYHFSGNFHRYVLSFRLGVPIPDPFLEDAAMASPKRRAGAFFRVGNTSQAYQPYTNIVALVKGYNLALYCAQTPMARMCSIRSPCRIGEFHVTPNAAHARHGRSCR